MRTNFYHFYRKFSKSSTNLTTKKWIQPENGYDTGIKIYNCIERKLVPLIIRNKNYATWYSCGPTVYDSAHIGHASCFVKFDIIQRILKDYFQINLITAMNITDIDDKIIQRSNELTKTNSKLIKWQDIAKKYEQEFWDNMKSLNINEPNIIVRVTENIPDIIAFIRKLIEDDKAYIDNDNSVYFKISNYSNYGKLVTINNENTDKLASNYDNKNIDFALWKAQKSKTEPTWSSPWGNGRPGWHIECSTLASKLFGSTIDFHAGGLDLKFPHHENEDAQSCSYHNNKQWINYWLHTGYLKLIDSDVKMSKSLKNTISIDELLKKYTSNEFRMACILSNYRNSMEFSDEMMCMARNTLNKLLSFQSDCKAFMDGKKSIRKFDENEILLKLNQTENVIENSLKDDFNTGKCLNVLIELTTTLSRLINTSATDIDDIEINSNLAVVAAANNYIIRILSIFGLNIVDLKVIVQNDNLNSNDFINDIIKIRDTLRNIAISNKHNYLFKICDDIRNDLQDKSIEIKDHNKGSSWNFAKKE